METIAIAIDQRFFLFKEEEEEQEEVEVEEKEDVYFDAHYSKGRERNDGL